MENPGNKNRNMRRAFYIAFMLLIPLVKSAVLMLIWNAILPDLFHFQPINYWQALGLFILCKILFGNSPSGKFAFRNKQFRKPDFREKFMNMSDEEKERLREKWQERCQK